MWVRERERERGVGCADRLLIEVQWEKTENRSNIVSFAVLTVFVLLLTATWRAVCMSSSDYQSVPRPGSQDSVFSSWLVTALIISTDIRWRQSTPRPLAIDLVVCWIELHNGKWAARNTAIVCFMQWQLMAVDKNGCLLANLPLFNWAAFMQYEIGNRTCDIFSCINTHVYTAPDLQSYWLEGKISLGRPIPPVSWFGEAYSPLLYMKSKGMRNVHDNTVYTWWAILK